MLLFQIEGTKYTRIVIDGDPGAGKTTFIKRLCYIWAQSVLHPEERDTEDEYLHKYTLVIPIILRFVKEQNTIMDLFTSQLNFLYVYEVSALVSLLETKPSEVLLLLDGYDEYTGQPKVISKAITKEECTNVLTITTSRPHAIDQLRRHTSQAVDQHVKLCGFNQKHIKQYIRLFCDYHKLKHNEGEDLIKTLLEERTDILEVAKIPLRTEMICTVWVVYGKLGQTLADLYEMFIIHLITRWESKMNSKDLSNNKPKSIHEVIKESKPLLLKRHVNNDSF